MHLKFTLQDYVSVGISLEHCTTISENSLVELEALKTCYMVIIPIKHIIMSNETCEIYKVTGYDQYHDYWGDIPQLSRNVYVY